MAYRITAWLLVIFALTALPAPGAGAQSMRLLEQIAPLIREGKNNEVIAELQRPIDAGETLSSMYLMYLGNAYFEVRDYRGVLTTADAMDRRIAAGDRYLYAADLLRHVAGGTPNSRLKARLKAASDS
jgi:hypothetical protein